MLSHMAHAAAHAGRRRNAGSSGTGTATMAPALGGIGTGGVAAARGSIGTAGVTPARGSTATTRGTIATTGMAPATATATATAMATATATAIIRDGDLAGRQMSANQCDRSSGQRRTNHRGNHEPLQPL
jgi:hypothetical protein